MAEINRMIGTKMSTTATFAATAATGAAATAAEGTDGGLQHELAASTELGFGGLARGLRGAGICL
jgi:hypothetical protein